jgi:hypothetical protein
MRFRHPLSGIVRYLGVSGIICARLAFADFTSLHLTGSASIGGFQLGDSDISGAITIDGEGQPATLTIVAPIFGPGSISGSSQTNPQESLVVESELTTSAGSFTNSYHLEVDLPTTLNSSGTLAADTLGFMDLNQPLYCANGTIAGTLIVDPGAIHSAAVDQAGIINVHDGITISGTLDKIGESYLYLSGGGITFAAGSILDIREGWFAMSGPSAAATIRQWVVSAYDGGKWDGDGISSSLARNSSSIGIGIADASTAGTGLGSPDFDFPASTLFVRPTYYGDCGLNGNVDLDYDFNSYIIGLNGGKGIAGLNGQGSGWGYGDFNYDGATDIAGDFPLFVRGYLASGGTADALVSAIETSPYLLVDQKSQMEALVPEPGSLIASLGLFAALSIRRKRTTP